MPVAANSRLPVHIYFLQMLMKTESAENHFAIISDHLLLQCKCIPRVGPLRVDNSIVFATIAIIANFC